VFAEFGGVALKKPYTRSALRVNPGKLLPCLNAEEIDRWFDELAKAPSAIHRHELSERISDAVSRFMMIDKDILCRALIASTRDLSENALEDTLPVFSL
jgi:hypothetical protein